MPLTMTENLLHIITYEQARLMPPTGEVCSVCASNHEAHEPHNAASLRFHQWFAEQERRSGRVPREPTWDDAAEHCDRQTRQIWHELLVACGIDSANAS
jgi:hypothetical protein